MPTSATVAARSSKPAGPTKGRARPTSTGTDRAAPATPSIADLWARVAWLVTAVAWLFLGASLLSFNAADAPSHVVWPTNTQPANWCGATGAAVSYHVLRFVGGPIWLFMLGVGVVLALPLLGRRVEHLAVRLVGLVLIVASAATALAILAPGAGPMPDLAGGMLGTVVSTELLARFGVVGAVLWSLLGLAIGAIVAMDRWLVTIPKYLMERSRPTAARVGKKAAEVTAAGAGVAARGGSWAIVAAWHGLVARIASLKPRPRVRPDDVSDDLPSLRRAQNAAAAKRRKAMAKIKPIREGAGGIGGVDAFDPNSEEAEADAEGEALEEGVGPVMSASARWGGKAAGRKGAVVAGDAAGDGALEAESDADADESDQDMPGAPQVFTEDALREKIARLPVRFAASSRRSATEDDLRDVQNVAELEGYRFPGLDLLEEPEKNFSSRLEELVRGQAQALESALQQYRINGEVVDIESGPVITLYHVRMAPGTKVAQLSAVASDVARALKAVNIRIVPNIPGRDTVGVEVPNPTKERVRLKELMSNTDWFGEMKLPMFLGKDASGDPLISDLTSMPHMLIAGTTGSGKSVCMNTIIMSFLYTKKPNELKLVLVDPKMVEMSQFKDIPHLMCPVVTEMAKAAAILEWAVRKMDERYELLAEAGCRDISAYNEMTWEELRDAFKPATEREESLIPRKLPYMVFIIDELADLMMTNKEVEGAIIRIAQKARAVGIHLILATQRPQANVVTGLIKSNMPCRIAFKVASGMDSRIVLDQKGGELLLGQGDMLYLSPRTSKLCRAQGTLVDDKEIRRVVRFMRDVAAPTFERQLVQLRSPDADEERILESKNNSSASLAAAQEDPMFDRAVEIVLESKRGSVSLLQRRLAIGYTRASRLIDLMGIAGIIGEHKGSVAREVVITLDDWATMKRLANEEAKRLGIEGTLFEGTGSGGATAVAPSGFATDLEDGLDLRAPERIDAAADLDMSVGGAGRAAGAGPLIGGRDADDDEAMDLSEPEVAAVATAPPAPRRAEPDRQEEPPFEATPTSASAGRAAAIAVTPDTDALDADADEPLDGAAGAAADEDDAEVVAADDESEYEDDDETEEDEEYDEEGDEDEEEEADEEEEGDDEEYEDDEEAEEGDEEEDEDEEEDGSDEEDEESDEDDEEYDEEEDEEDGDDEEYEEEGDEEEDAEDDESDDSEEEDDEDPDAEDAEDSDAEESDDEYEYEYEYVEVDEDAADESPSGDADGSDDDATDAEPPQVNIPAPRPAASPKGRRRAG